MLLLLCCAAAYRPPLFVRVYAETNAQGFLDPGATDSVKDLERALPHHHLAVTTDPSRADMTIVITGRATGSQIIGSDTSIQRGVFGGLFSSTTQVVGSNAYVFTRMEINGEVVTQVYGSGHHGIYPYWSLAADAIAKYYEQFVKTNDAKIREMIAHKK